MESVTGIGEAVVYQSAIWEVMVEAMLEAMVEDLEGLGAMVIMD